MDATAPRTDKIGAAIRAIGDAIIDRLDLTSFGNSVGPRREAGRHSFSDYGCTVVERTANGAKLYREGATG